MNSFFLPIFFYSSSQVFLKATNSCKIISGLVFQWHKPLEAIAFDKNLILRLSEGLQKEPGRNTTLHESRWEFITTCCESRKANSRFSFKTARYCLRTFSQQPTAKLWVFSPTSASLINICTAWVWLVDYSALHVM